jgi:hypothetical protein
MGVPISTLFTCDKGIHGHADVLHVELLVDNSTPGTKWENGKTADVAPPCFRRTNIEYLKSSHGSSLESIHFIAKSLSLIMHVLPARLKLGAKKVNDLEDHGFMVSWGFEDLNGHMWDLFWMNPEHVE